MLTYAILAFGIAAVGGLILAVHILKGKLAPWFLSIIHALLGATGLVILGLISIKGEGSSQITAALAILIVAALGGFYLASLHLRGQVAPKGVVIIHAGVAVVGFLLLLAVALGL